MLDKLIVYVKLCLVFTFLFMGCRDSSSEIKERWDNGRVKREVLWKSRSDSSFVINLYHRSGQLKQKTNYRNSLKNGKRFDYSEDGTILGEMTFRNDTLHGKLAEYYSNGQEAWISIKDNGKSINIDHEYYYNGQKMKEMIISPKPIRYINFWDTSGVQTLVLGEGYFYEYALDFNHESLKFIPQMKIFVKDSLEVSREKINSDS